MTSSMLAKAGPAFPGEKTVVDVVGVEDGRVATSVVQALSGDEIILTLPQDRDHRSVRPEPGTRLELVWKDLEGLLALPVEVTAIERDAESLLRVRGAGPVVPGQRRYAVRAPLVLPVQLTHGQEQLSGLTLDLSEGGMRCLLDPLVEQPTAPTQNPANRPANPADKLAVGDRMPAVVTFDTAVVEGRVEVVRRHSREDGRSELSLRFVGLPEVTQDLIRRAVFASLRDLRLRGLI